MCGDGTCAWVCARVRTRAGHARGRSEGTPPPGRAARSVGPDASGRPPGPAAVLPAGRAPRVRKHLGLLRSLSTHSPDCCVPSAGSPTCGPLCGRAPPPPGAPPCREKPRGGGVGCAPRGPLCLLVSGVGSRGDCAGPPLAFPALPGSWLLVAQRGWEAGPVVSCRGPGPGSPFPPPPLPRRGPWTSWAEDRGAWAGGLGGHRQKAGHRCSARLFGRNKKNSLRSRLCVLGVLMTCAEGGRATQPGLFSCSCTPAPGVPAYLLGVWGSHCPFCQGGPRLSRLPASTAGPQEAGGGRAHPVSESLGSLDSPCSVSSPCRWQGP